MEEIAEHQVRSEDPRSDVKGVALMNEGKHKYKKGQDTAEDFEAHAVLEANCYSYRY